MTHIGPIGESPAPEGFQIPPPERPPGPPWWRTWLPRLAVAVVLIAALWFTWPSVKATGTWVTRAPGRIMAWFQPAKTAPAPGAAASTAKATSTATSPTAQTFNEEKVQQLVRTEISNQLEEFRKNLVADLKPVTTPAPAPPPPAVNTTATATTISTAQNKQPTNIRRITRTTATKPRTPVRVYTSQNPIDPEVAKYILDHPEISRRR